MSGSSRSCLRAQGSVTLEFAEYKEARDVRWHAGAASLARSGRESDVGQLFAAAETLSGSPDFSFPDGGRWALTWEWLLRLRGHGGLPGHAEMEGRTLFLSSVAST